jgi:small-conductance mechanosensitive channel
MDLKQWIAHLGKTLDSVLEYLPNLVSFLGILLLGWVLARILQTWTVHLMRGLDRMVRSRVLQREHTEIGLDQSAPVVISRIVFWIILFFFIAAATETLGLSIISTLLSGFTQYLPNVLAAALIGFAGFFASSIVRKTITSAASSTGVPHADLLGRSTQVIILLIVLLICMDQIGIDIKFLMILITIILGTLLGGLALAFGLGAKMTVSNMISSHYLARTYQVGQTVKIGSIQGRIVEMTPSAVVLDTKEGRVLIPAAEFNEKISVLIAPGG